jgi:hypothetical protein
MTNVATTSASQTGTRAPPVLRDTPPSSSGTYLTKDTPDLSSSTPSSSTAAAPYPRLKAYLYCIGQKELFDGLWDLDLVNALEYVDQVNKADLVIHRRPKKGEKQYYYEQYRQDATAKGIPFISIWSGSAEELRLGLVPVLDMYAGRKGMREAVTRVWRGKVKPNKRIKV